MINRKKAPGRVSGSKKTFNARGMIFPEKPYYTIVSLGKGDLSQYQGNERCDGKHLSMGML